MIFYSALKYLSKHCNSDAFYGLDTALYNGMLQSILH
jgi:hypothetical protein